MKYQNNSDFTRLSILILKDISAIAIKLKKQCRYPAILKLLLRQFENLVKRKTYFSG